MNKIILDEQPLVRHELWQKLQSIVSQDKFLFWLKNTAFSS